MNRCIECKSLEMSPDDKSCKKGYNVHTDNCRGFEKTRKGFRNNNIEDKGYNDLEESDFDKLA